MFNPPAHEDFPSQNHYQSYRSPNERSSYLNENNYSSINSNLFKNDEFNSVQVNFTYNLQMGFSSKISSMLKASSLDSTQEAQSFLTSRLQEFSKYEDAHFKTPKDLQLKPPKEIFFDEIAMFPKESQGFFEHSERKHHVFISAVTLLLGNPALLSRIFETESINEPGIYGVWLCDDGIWKLTLIDEKIPCVGSKYAFHEFFVGKDRFFFNILLEKALAKLYGGYEQLSHVKFAQILGNLTGSQAEIKNLYELQAYEDVWSLIRKWREANFLVFFQQDSAENHGENLCFSLVECVEIVPKDETDVLQKIVKLKSPLKGVILDGVCQKHAELSADVRKKLKINSNSPDDCTFFLTLDECFKHFAEIGVCKALNRLNSSYYSVNVKSSAQFIAKIRVEIEGKIVFSFYQRQKNGALGAKNNSFLRVLLAKDGDSLSDMQFLAGEYSNQPVFIEKVCQSGDYVAVMENITGDYEENAENVIGCLCENDLMVGFEIVAKKPQEILEIQKNLLKNYAKSMESKTMRIRDFSSSNEPSIKIYNDMVFGFSYFYYINDSKMKLRETISMQTLNNLTICAPFKDSNAIEIELAPKSDLLVLYKYDKNGKDFSYAMTIKSNLERANSIILSSQIKYENSENKMMTSKMKSSSINSHPENPKDELIKIIKERGSLRKRLHNNEEIEVLVYTHVHSEGLIFLYCNNSDKKFSEVITFSKLKNLHLNCRDNNKKNFTEIALKPGQTELVIFNKVKDEEFSYSFKHEYKIEYC